MLFCLLIVRFVEEKRESIVCLSSGLCVIVWWLNMRMANFCHVFFHTKSSSVWYIRPYVCLWCMYLCIWANVVQISLSTIESVVEICCAIRTENVLLCIGMCLSGQTQIVWIDDCLVFSTPFVLCTTTSSRWHAILLNPNGFWCWKCCDGQQLPVLLSIHKTMHRVFKWFY